MARPTIFLAFANRQQEPFLDLSKEDDGIYDLFVSGKGRHKFHIHRDQYTSTDELIRYIQRFKNQISIFHFGGHAGNAQLYLSDQSAREKGIAGLLGKQKNLRCVFLNGCHTYALVDQLLQQGVPVVIATSRAVGNEEAVKLALHFYNELVKGATIEEAFESARDAAQTVGEVDIVMRDLAETPEAESSAPEQEFSWGLYHSDKKGLEWQLNQAVADVENVSSYFWFRVVFLIIAIFATLLWSNRHFGTSSTAFFLANGPLAIIGIATFVMKAFEKVSPAISNFSARLSIFFLKTPVLIAIGALVAGIAFFGSSIVVKHQEGNDLKMSVVNQKDQAIQHWQLESSDKTKSRVFLLSAPLRDSITLKVDGYQPQSIPHKPMLGNRLSTEDLQVKAALLVRLQLNDMRLAPRMKIRIDRPSGEPIIIDPVEKAAVLIGPQQTISAAIRQKWEQELTNLGISNTDMVHTLASKWADPNYTFENYTFKAGEKLVISKILNDSTYFEKEVIIVNQKINDVLLEI